MEYKLPFEKEKREIITIREGTTNPNYGKNPKDRTTKELLEYGIINLNKVSGPTSHQVSDYVKKILNLKKAGHSGTLDPKVTGVLPIALEKATKIVQTLLPAGKEYIALMHIHKKVPKEEIEKVFEDFTGKINQLPPIKSAVKRKIRPRKIYYLQLLGIEKKEALFRVGCQAGTYIRKLIHDMGLALDTRAHMTQLVRTKAGPFTDKDWKTLQDLKDAYEYYKKGNDKELRKLVQPFEVAVDHMKKVWVFDSVVANICHGSPLGVTGISKAHNNIRQGDAIAIMSLKDELVALSKSSMTSKEMKNKEKGLAAITNKVFMPINLYPKKSYQK